MTENGQGADSAYTYTFVIVPKQVDHPFYDMVDAGCQETATQLGNIDCRYIGPVEVDAEEQAALIMDLVSDPLKYNISRVDGVAVAVIDESVTGAAIDFVHDAKIPVITFDSDAEQSKRQAFVGTDNTALGFELGKVLNQLAPEGGGYAMMTGSGPNLALRVNGVRKALNATNWEEVGLPVNCNDNFTTALEQMREFGRDPRVKAAVPVGGWPMQADDPTGWKAFVNQYRNMTTIVADSADIQILLMNQGYVDGLVGQLPFQMGNFSMLALLNIAQGKALRETYFGTHLLEILRVPLHLPPVDLNNNYIGSLVYLGYVFFAVVSLLSIGFSLWTFVHRNTHVVRASQPAFMVMICSGALIMGAAIVPLSIDDENYSQRGTDIACMSFPWLMAIGFCTIFSALFSKTWRIVALLEKAQRLKRVKISVKDVLAPFFALLTVNVITLVCWTVINPLVYKRLNDVGVDGWNRVISTHGGCVSSNDAKGGATPYVVILTVVNGGLLVIANVMSYRARNIRTEFHESGYITIVMASMLQAGFIGIPIFFLTLDQPKPNYVVLVFLIFAVCVSTLLFMFWPKIQALNSRKKAVRRNTDSSADDGEAGLTVTWLSRRPLSLKSSYCKRSPSKQAFESDYESVNRRREIFRKQSLESDYESVNRRREMFRNQSLESDYEGSSRREFVPSSTVES